MADIAINRHVVYNTTVCITCGVDIVMPSEMYEHRLKNHQTFYCPSGHSQQFIGETEEARLKRVLAERDQQLAIKERALKFERERTATLEQREKKLKRRLAVGVCPCCQRTVSQLARHMKTKHPDFAQPDNAVAKGRKVL